MSAPTRKSICSALRSNYGESAIRPSRPNLTSSANQTTGRERCSRRPRLPERCPNTSSFNSGSGPLSKTTWKQRKASCAARSRSLSIGPITLSGGQELTFARSPQRRIQLPTRKARKSGLNSIWTGRTTSRSLQPWRNKRNLSKRPSDLLSRGAIRRTRRCAASTLGKMQIFSTCNCGRRICLAETATRNHAPGFCTRSATHSDRDSGMIRHQST